MLEGGRRTELALEGGDLALGVGVGVGSEDEDEAVAGDAAAGQAGDAVQVEDAPFGHFHACSTLVPTPVNEEGAKGGALRSI